LANSTAYSGGSSVDSVHKAVSRIGLAQIRETVLNLEIVDRFAGLRCGRIRADWFWEHSIAVGLIASRLARRAGAGAEAGDAMFTAGLLHDIGRMLLTEVLADQYGAVLQAAERLELPLELVESRLLMVNHAELTDRVLRSWKFPPELINPIAFHHLTMGEARQTVPSMMESVAILGLANRMAHALLIGSSGNEVIYPTREHLRGLQVDPALADELCEQVPPETAEMRMVLMARGSEGVAESFEQQVQQRLRGAGPALSISGAPGLDPFDRLAARLWGRSPESPTAAVVYVHNPHEAEAAAAQLRAREAEIGRLLPAVVVSPTGTVGLPPDAQGGRYVQLLACPTTIGRFARALRAVCGLGDAPPPAGAKGSV
ncbi:MAG: HDOD domain-containing protein, partial [Phycisphaerales bacterium]